MEDLTFVIIVWVLNGSHLALIQEDDIDKVRFRARLENEDILVELPLLLSELLLKDLLKYSFPILGPNLQDEVALVECTKTLV